FESEIHMIGRVARADVPALLAQNHILLHPSLKESFSQTLLEGKLAGLTTLANRDLEVPPEFIDKPLEFDPAVWASEIMMLTPSVISAEIDDIHLARLQELRSKYDRRAMAKRTLSVLEPA